jgi:hypothetical protein
MVTRSLFPLIRPQVKKTKDKDKDDNKDDDRRYGEAIQDPGVAVTSNSTLVTSGQNDQLAGITTTEPWRNLVFHLVDTVSAE